MEKNALELVKLRNDFYRDNFRRMIWVLLICLVIIVVMLVGLLTMAHRQPRSYYFASTTDGRIIPLAPLQVPVISDEAVRSWVARNVPQIYTLDFVHYRQQYQRLHQYFTPFGWEQFTNAFSSQLNKVVSQRLITSASPSNVAIITGKAVIDGVFSWRIQLPLVISIQKGNTQSVEHVTLRLIVQRVNNVGSNELLGISQIVQQPVQEGG